MKTHLAVSELVKDQIYDPHFTKRFKERKPGDFRMEFNLTIYAVGVTVETALLSLGETLGWGRIENIDFQPVDVPCNWHVRFHAGGTSMKAAGQYVTGGVIVTWWK